jgi:soluble lytic murein transglycosylase
LAAIGWHPDCSLNKHQEFFMSKWLTFFLLMAAGQLQATTPVRALAAVKDDVRVGHARELLGSSYEKSFVAGFENQKGLEQKILKIVERRLPAAHKGNAHAIAETIIASASQHSLDPYFIMAVITGESSFNPNAIGPVGEIGLMQIRPATGAWIAKKIDFQWNGKATLLDPVSNIKLGAAYIAWLREKFSKHGRLYLAAYNMGPRSLQNALGRNIWPKDYPRHVMKRYFALYKEI